MMKITRGWALVAAFAAAALVLSFYHTPAGSAQEAGGTTLERGQPVDGLVEGGLDDVAIDAFALRGGDVDIVIELNEEPTAKVYSKALARGRQKVGRQRGGDPAKAMPEVARQANAEARGQLDRISRSQSAVLAHLRAPGVNGKIIFQTQRVFNGFGARVSASSLERIKSLPEVKAIYELVPNVLDDTLTTKFIKSPEAWVSRPSGNAGEGVKIGIIDTGIDYIHTNMGGPGTGYAANNTAINGDSVYPSAKVVGGRDFVGDAYTGSAATIAPDPDPMDCNGHGSHVAGTAAGLGVTAAGATYTGAYDGSTPFNTMRIGPGVAPKAELYALKVFGCSGSTGVTPQAIEWAVDPNGDGDFSDHLDVINMSLGSPFGTAFDASAVASDNAVLAGVIVVASAGNSGDTHYINGSPGSSGRTISVAATTGDGSPAVKINGPAGVAGFKAVGLGTRPALTNPGVTANVVLSNDGSTAPFAGSPAGTVGTTADACQSITNGAAVSGRIAMVERGGGCSFDVKVKNAQNVGAVGVIVADNAPGVPIGMTISDLSILIPSVRVSQADGNLLKANLAGLNATIALTQYAGLPEAGDTVGSFSSRGVRRGDNALKPDVSAPGVSITSTASGSGTQGRDLNGTSMAAPHVAGAMALLRQLHPAWSVEELKALLMNTATQDLFSAQAQTPPKYGVGRVGAGRVNMENASSNEVVAMNAEGGGLVSLSFGSVEVLGTTTREKTVRVVNKGDAPQTFALSYVTMTDVPGVTYTFPDGDSLTIGAGETATFRVQFNATAALMKHTRDATIAATQSNTLRHFLSEASGYVVLTPESGRPLRLSAHAFARPASAMTTQQQSLLLAAPTGTATLNLTGQDVNTGNLLPTDERSFVTAFELAATSPDEPNNLNMRNNADLKSVGIASDFKVATSLPNSIISLGIATHGKWTTMYDVEFDVYFDTNSDGVDDYVLFTTATVNGTAPNTNRNDIPVVSLQKLAAPGAGAVAGSTRFVNGFTGGQINTVPYNTNVAVMLVRAGDLGLTAANSKFRYRVLGFDRNTGTAVDVISGLSYDAAKPGLNVQGGVAGMPWYFDLNGGTIPVAYNVADFKAANSKGVLLLHHHNTDGARDQAIPFVEPAATTTTVGAAAGQYSDLVTLTATVSPITLLDHTASGNVTFSVGGTSVGSAPIDSAGVASLPYAIAQPQGGHAITAAFASTSPAFLASGGANTLTVTKEDAVVTPSASNPASAKVNSAGGTAGPITLSAQIVEVSDGSLGDIAKAAPVTFTLVPVGPGPAITQAATLGGSGAGPLTASITLTNVPVNVYDVTITIGGDYYAGSAGTVLAVFDPSLGNVTGGGTILRDGVRATFGFNVKYLKNGNAQGQLLYMEHRPDGIVKLKSNAMGTASIAGDTAVIIGKATLGGVGNHGFRATVVDKGEPGSSDHFGLQVTNPAGAQVSDLWFGPVTIAGGNIQVPGKR